MMYQIPPKLAMINDLTGYGRCSLAVAIPVVSALKVQACPVPTSLFSNHMAFPTWSFQDLTEEMPAYLEGFARLNLRFDGIYCGFLGNAKQVAVTEQFILSQPQALVILDPVMGDHGRLYSSVTPAHCQEMKKLLKLAHLITPNITEACLLTDAPYQENGWTTETLQPLADTLHHMGSARVVITGIREDENYLNFVSCKEGTGILLSSPAKGQSRPGTGDLFASILAADALREIPLEISVKKAASFIGHCTEISDRAGIPVEEGVLFENALSMLI